MLNDRWPVSAESVAHDRPSHKHPKFDHGAAGQTRKTPEVLGQAVALMIAQAVVF